MPLGPDFARGAVEEHGWVYTVLTFMIAFAFACPLFLPTRERYLRARSV